MRTGSVYFLLMTLLPLLVVGKTSSLVGGSAEKGRISKAKLEIQPSESAAVAKDKLFLRIEEGNPLNLTCFVDGSTRDSEYELNWYLFNYVDPTRISQSSASNAHSLVFSEVKLSDSGEYKCTAVLKIAGNSQSLSGNPNPLVRTIHLKIVLPDGKCGPKFYQCKSGVCIATRYQCDGFPDCPDEDDEALTICGPNPCSSKIWCEDHRCMDPRLCCNPDLDRNCTVFPKCCVGLLELNRHLHQMRIKELNRSTAAANNVFHHVYTVAGCSLAFVVVVVLIVVTVCRLQAKAAFRRDRGRMMVTATTTTRDRARGSSQAHPPITLHDLDVYFSSLRRVDSSHSLHHPGITYNINNGVQIVGRPIQPPAYSAVVGETTNYEGPPPPYTEEPSSSSSSSSNRRSIRRSSHHHYHHHHHHRRYRQRPEEEAFIPQEDDNNNNGDINGNDNEMMDNNALSERQRQVVQSGGDFRPPPPPHRTPPSALRIAVNETSDSESD